MATYAQTVRRGLPRRPGGDPWPPASDGAASPIADARSGSRRARRVAGAAATGASVAAVATAELPVAEPPTRRRRRSLAAPPRSPSLSSASPAPARRRAHRSAAACRALPGGEPWPPGGCRSRGASVAAAAAAATPRDARAGRRRCRRRARDRRGSRAGGGTVRRPRRSPRVRRAAGRPLRRGLPRVAGRRAVARRRVRAGTRHARCRGRRRCRALDELGDRGAATGAEVTDSGADALPRSGGDPRPRSPSAAADRRGADVICRRCRSPARCSRVARRSCSSGSGSPARGSPTPEPKRIGPFTRLQWAGAVIVGGGGLLFAAGMAVLAVRFLLSLEPHAGLPGRVSRGSIRCPRARRSASRRGWAGSTSSTCS